MWNAGSQAYGNIKVSIVESSKACLAISVLKSTGELTPLHIFHSQKTTLSFFPFGEISDRSLEGLMFFFLQPEVKNKVTTCSQQHLNNWFNLNQLVSNKHPIWKGGLYISNKNRGTMHFCPALKKHPCHAMENVSSEHSWLIWFQVFLVEGYSRIAPRNIEWS